MSLPTDRSLPTTSFETNMLAAEDSKRFEGHFPGAPLLPALAQLTDLILPVVRQRFGGGALIALNRVKWTRPIPPGAKLVLKVEKKKEASDWIHFELRFDDAKACAGSLRLDTTDEEKAP